MWESTTLAPHAPIAWLDVPTVCHVTGALTLFDALRVSQPLRTAMKKL
jgi:hypothetical protein